MALYLKGIPVFHANVRSFCYDFVTHRRKARGNCFPSMRGLIELNSAFIWCLLPLNLRSFIRPVLTVLIFGFDFNRASNHTAIFTQN